MREGAAVWGASAVRRLRSAAALALRRGALITLAVFAVVGLAVLDDYGVSTDEANLRLRVGGAALDYVLSLGREPLASDVHRFYGVAFELPLAAVERVFGLEDSRAVYLSRHLLTHLFFLAGGFFAWLLVYRMFGSRALALFAMLLFLLHPRMYAHSFFNTKDIPFSERVHDRAVPDSSGVSAGFGGGVRALRRGRRAADEYPNLGRLAVRGGLGDAGARPVSRGAAGGRDGAARFSSTARRSRRRRR